jgi:epoxyqueuosine reductase
MIGEGKSAGSIVVQDSLSKVDIDMIGIVSMQNLNGSKLEKDALELLPEVRSLIVFAAEVYPEFLRHSRPEKVTGAASLSDLLSRHFDYLNSRLTKAAYDVAKVSRRNGLKALPLPAATVDARFLDSSLSFKHLAQAAGIGQIGKSSLLLTGNYGPRLRLSACLTEAALEPTQPLKTNIACEDCDVCIKGCPAKALGNPQASEPYAINKFACSAYRNASGGCSECMRLCPAGR